MGMSTFRRFGGLMAILAGIAGFLYAVAFILLQQQLLYSIFLTLLGLFSTAALVAVYESLREIDAGFALWGLLMGLIGSSGSAIHGGYDLANSLNPPSSLPANIAGLPSQVDPRGLLTFGFAGVSVFVIAWLITRSSTLPHNLGLWGYLAGALLVILYLGRLIVLSPTNPLILIPALLSGFIVSPVWYVWIGSALWKGGKGVTAEG